MLTQEIEGRLNSCQENASSFKAIIHLKLGQENIESRWSFRGLPRLKTAEKTEIEKILKNKLKRINAKSY